MALVTAVMSPPTKDNDARYVSYGTLYMRNEHCSMPAFQVAGCARAQTYAPHHTGALRDMR